MLTAVLFPPENVLKKLPLSASGRGAQYLDNVLPQWFCFINSTTINVADAKKCPLGQIYGTAEKACVIFNLPEHRSFLLAHGFEASSFDGYAKNVATLNAEWRKHVEKRISVFEDI